MPGYKGHIAGGLITGALAVAALFFAGTAIDLPQVVSVRNNPDQIPAIMLFCLLGALFPDTDTDSKGQNLFYAIFVVVDAVLIYKKAYQLAAWLGLFAMLPALGHHRGWTHSWLAMLLVGAPILVVPALQFGTAHLTMYLPFYLAFTLGYMSHLVLDKLL